MRYRDKSPVETQISRPVVWPRAVGILIGRQSVSRRAYGRGRSNREAREMDIGTANVILPEGTARSIVSNGGASCLQSGLAI
jgi:hypothetical protein